MLVVDPLNLGSARIIALREGRAAGRIHLAGRRMYRPTAT